MPTSHSRIHTHQYPPFAHLASFPAHPCPIPPFPAPTQIHDVQVYDAFGKLQVRVEYNSQCSETLAVMAVMAVVAMVTVMAVMVQQYTVK